MKYELHPACSAWPTMKPEELRELANDITANGLRDPVTLNSGRPLARRPESGVSLRDGERRARDDELQRRPVAVFAQP